MAIASLNGLATRYLRAHLKRTLLTILGVVLSVALVCASGLFGQALFEKGIETAKLSNGAFFASIEGMSRSQVEQLAANAKVDEVGYSLEAGAAMVSDALALAVLGGDPVFLRGMNLVVKEGRLPARPGEIVIEPWVGSAMGKPLSVGSMLDLNIVVRGSGGGAYLRTEHRSFSVTGLLEGWKMTQAEGHGLGIVTMTEAEEILGGGPSVYIASFTVRKGLPVQKSIKEIAASLGVEPSRVHQNAALLTAMGIGANMTMNRSVLNVELILAAVILLATVAVISNTFTISVLERIRQFGILRCVGSTPAQLRTLVLREALVVSVAGIPLGIGSGILAVLVVVRVLGMISLSFFGSLSVTLSLPVIAGSAGLGVVSVFLSALGPSLRAGRVPPLEAVLAPDQWVRERTRKRRHSLMVFLFGISGRMAAQNIARNRKRFFVTVGSIAIGVSLFIVFASLLGIMTAASGNIEQQPFARDVAVYARGLGGTRELTARDLSGVMLISGVRSVLAVREANGCLVLPDAAVTDEYRKYVRSTPLRTDLPDLRIPDSTLVPAAILGLGPDELAVFQTHVIEGVFDASRMAKENGVYLTRAFRAGTGTVRPATLRVGDRIQLGGRDGPGPGRVTAVVLGFVDSLTWSLVGDPLALGVVASEETFKAVTGKDTFTRFDIALESKTQSGEVADILRVVPAQAHGAGVEDFAGAGQSYSGILLQISILLYGLVTVISFIGALNIINTIGTSLILRVREFGMLRAVGMTDGQLRGMVTLEGLLYGLYSAVPGSLIGLLIARLLFSNVSRVQAIPWVVPWAQMIGACLAAIAIGMLSALVPLRRIGALSVVESIRAEE